jgi:hypothetical protein
MNSRGGALGYAGSLIVSWTLSSGTQKARRETDKGSITRLLGGFLGQTKGAQLGGALTQGTALGLVIRHRLDALLRPLLLLEAGFGPVSDLVCILGRQATSPFRRCCADNSPSWSLIAAPAPVGRGSTDPSSDTLQHIGMKIGKKSPPGLRPQGKMAGSSGR